MLNIEFNENASSGPVRHGDTVITDRLRFTIGLSTYTLAGGKNGFTVTKVHQVSPLEESVSIQPIHTNKVIIS